MLWVNNGDVIVSDKNPQISVSMKSTLTLPSHSNSIFIGVGVKTINLKL